MDKQNDDQEQERDWWIPRGSECGQAAQRDEQEVRDPSRQYHSTAPPTPSSDLLPGGYDRRYDARHKHNGRKNHCQVE